MRTSLRVATLLIATLCGAGCRSDDPAGSKSDDPDDTAGTGTPDTTGTEATGIEAEVSEYVHTVVIVRWTTELESSGHVVFGESDGYGLRTADTPPGTFHEVLLLGLPPDTEAHFKVVSADGATASADQVILTGPLPAGLPVLTLTGDPAAFDGWHVTSVQGTENALVILDGQGRYVWYALTGTTRPMRVLFDRDGGGLSAFVAGSAEELAGNLLRVSIDGSTRVFEGLEGLDHDMLEREDGTFAALTNQPDPTAATSASATGVREYADGTSTLVWSAWDDIDPEVYGADLSEGGNWTHGNAIEYVPENDEYLVSLADLPQLVSVDRTTGDVNWTLFGDHGDFALGAGSETVPRMHQMDRWDDRLLVFDNGDTERGYSRAVEFQLDLATMTATQVWEYIHDPPLYVYVLGDVERLDDGNTVVTWATAGEIEVVSPEGEVLSRISADLGGAFTYDMVTPTLYPGGG